MDQLDWERGIWWYNSLCPIYRGRCYIVTPFRGSGTRLQNFSFRSSGLCFRKLIAICSKKNHPTISRPAPCHIPISAAVKRHQIGTISVQPATDRMNEPRKAHSRFLLSNKKPASVCSTRRARLAIFPQANGLGLVERPIQVQRSAKQILLSRT